jgi:hypothetical protein
MLPLAHIQIIHIGMQALKQTDHVLHEHDTDEAALEAHHEPLDTDHRLVVDLHQSG